MPDNMTSNPPPDLVSSNFFTSKPFIILVLSGIVLCGGIKLFQSLSDNTVLSFSFTLDEKGLPADRVPEVYVDGQTFTSGSKIKFGKHELGVRLQNAEPYGRSFWVFYGKKDLGTLPLETSKGSLLITVNPSPATVVVQRNGKTVTQGAAPLDVRKLPVGNYTLVVKRADYEETRTVDIRRQQATNAIVELNLGRVELSSIPADAEYAMSGNGHLRQGKLPARLEDVPVGNYTLVVKRGDYEETHTLSIQRQQTTNEIVKLNLGKIELSSIPADAEYAMSGNGHRWQGKLPAHLEDVPVGNYSLSVTRRDWELDSDVSAIRGGVTTNITEFPYGSISVTSTPPGLVVSTNGVEIGKTPITLQELKPAPYNLTISDGDNDLMATVKVGAMENAEHTFLFHYGTVQLMSEPAGAAVIRKGKEIGKTPLILNHIPVGETMLALQLKDYVSTNLAVQTVEGITNQLLAKLISEHYLQAMKQAHEAFSARQFDQSQKFLAAALAIQPNDLSAIQLRDEVAIGVAEVAKTRAKAAEAVRAEQANAKAQETAALAQLNFQQVMSDCSDTIQVQNPVMMNDGYYDKNGKFIITGQHTEIHSDSVSTFNEAQFGAKYIGKTFKFDSMGWKITKIEKDGTLVFRSSGSRNSLQLGQDEIRAIPSLANQGQFLSVKNSQRISIKARIKSHDRGDFFSRVLQRITLEDAELLDK